MSRNLLTDYQMFKHNSNELYNIQVPHFHGHQITRVTGPPWPRFQFRISLYMMKIKTVKRIRKWQAPDKRTAVTEITTFSNETTAVSHAILSSEAIKCQGVILNLYRAWEFNLLLRRDRTETTSYNQTELYTSCSVICEVKRRGLLTLGFVSNSNWSDTFKKLSGQTLCIMFKKQLKKPSIQRQTAEYITWAGGTSKWKVMIEVKCCGAVNHWHHPTLQFTRTVICDILIKSTYTDVYSIAIIVVRSYNKNSRKCWLN